MAKASVVAAQTAEALERIEAKLDALIAALQAQQQSEAKLDALIAALQAQQQSAGKPAAASSQPTEDKKK